MKRPRSRERRGFTLIELMLVVAILGILSALAIPKFQKFRMRAQTVERTNVMAAIRNDFMLYYSTNDNFPAADGSRRPVGGFSTTWNPADPHGGVFGEPRSWSKHESWWWVGGVPLGMLRYRYHAWGGRADNGTYSWLFLEAHGDLDANGVKSVRSEGYIVDRNIGNVWTRYDGWWYESPPGVF